VGRTSICYCHQGDDDMEEVGKAPAWTRHRWRWRGVEVGMEEERTRGVDPAAVGEAPVWTRLRSARRSRSGRMGGGKMIPPGLGFKEQPCN
jgi:hypothetical protein